MKTIGYLLGVMIIALTLFTSSGCKKQNMFSTDTLSFSQDTVVFDTVFTTIGSTTKRFKFYNNDNNPVNVDEIELMGGSSSNYRINVDGVSGTSFSDIVIQGNDSLFVFVEVTLDPNSLTNPLIIQDSIRFRTNGVDQFVQLAAWGQDAYFHYKDVNSGTWPNDKPHVIYGYAGVDSADVLTIQAGTDIYLHKGAILYVYKGSLNIEGTCNNPVTFQGDRLEAEYDDVSGQYYGIYFHQALPSKINFAEIKNGTSGVHLYDDDPANVSYTLEMTNTKIENCARYGVFIYSGAKVKAENCLIAKNGNHALLVLEGGDYNFNHCHLVGYGSGEASVPAVGLSNYYYDVGTGFTNVGSINEGTITNSVIYGNLEQEIAIDTIPDALINLNFVFNNNVIRSEELPTDNFFVNNIFNQDPLFVDMPENDFTIWSNSPMRDASTNLFPKTIFESQNIDLNCNPLNLSTSQWDIGAYEFQ